MKIFFFFLIVLIASVANLLIGFAIALIVGRGPASARQVFFLYWPFGLFALGGEESLTVEPEVVEKTPKPKSPPPMIDFAVSNDDARQDDDAPDDGESLEEGEDNSSEEAELGSTHENSSSDDAPFSSEQNSSAQPEDASVTQTDESESTEIEQPKFQAPKKKKSKGLPPLLNVSDPNLPAQKTVDIDNQQEEVPAV